MIGPAVAGLLIAAVGTGWIFIINAASFGAVLWSLAALRVHELHRHERTAPKFGRLHRRFPLCGRAVPSSLRS
jgi:hypothetical protein